MHNKKIIFMGTPNIAADYLNSLIKNKINIFSVITQPPKKQSRGMKIIKSPVHTLAEENDLKVLTPQIFDNEIIYDFKKIQPDLIIVVAYGKILPKEILELPKLGCINIHLSILPRWRGAAPIEHTLINGDKESGISIIKLVEKLDAGPIIIQEKFTIPDDYNKLKLTNNLTKIGTKLLVRTIGDILKNKISLTYQDESKVTFAHKLNSIDRKINFKNNSKKIINQIKAYSPKPGAWFILNKDRIKIIEAKPGLSKGKASTILNENFEIGCNDGSINPQLLQKEGRNVIKKEDFLRGFKFKIGDVINE